MKIVIFGLAISSSWGNGHATTYRALGRALHARGHRIVFFERDWEWYRDNRDLPEPDFCDLRIYEEWPDALPAARRALRDADLAIVGSYFPDAARAVGLVLDSAALKAFYDIDTPVTVAELRRTGHAPYLRREEIPGFDLYLSFTGGPMLRELETVFGARLAAPLYCSFDPAMYRPRPPARRFTCDMSYMGTYAADRQPKVDELLGRTATGMPHGKFIVAGSQYPKSVRWPANVKRIVHLNPRWHPLLYSSSRLTLNVTRRDMVLAGYSPSVRLFEAAACGATIVSDNWPGLEAFFVPGKEILLASSADDVRRYLDGMDAAELRRMGAAARERVIAEHTSDRRARQLELLVERASLRAAEAASALAPA
ncbi:MAG TPA: glycosyltransferase [Terriglobales bacterium]|nr:glycosyltransferase [Terriglobales bacterium]